MTTNPELPLLYMFRVQDNQAGVIFIARRWRLSDMYVCSDRGGCCTRDARELQSTRLI